MSSTVKAIHAAADNTTLTVAAAISPGAAPLFVVTFDYKTLEQTTNKLMATDGVGISGAASASSSLIKTHRNG